MQNILLVDDQQGVHDLWAELHKEIDTVFQGNCKFDSALTIEEMEQNMIETEYDAIIFDLVMPPGGIDEGVNFIADHARSFPPIIALTGHEDIFIRRRCIIAGAADFWTKRDAQRVPDLFFKSLYNEYVKRYVPKA